MAWSRRRRPSTEAAGLDSTHGQTAMPFMNAQVPAVQVRIATAPVPQQAWPEPPQASQVFAPPVVGAVHWAPLLQVPRPPPVVLGQHR